MAQEARTNRFGRKFIPSVTPREVPQPEGVSGTRKALAGVVRGASGLGGSFFSPVLGPGTGTAFAVGGLGELIAQAIEENSPNQFDPQSLARAALEGGITAIPGSVLFKGGRVLSTMKRGGALAGSGEYLRELLRGEKPDISSVLTSTLIGAGTGGLLSRFLPVEKAVSPLITKSIDDLLGDVNLMEKGLPAFIKELPEVMRKGGWAGNLDRIVAEAKRLDAAGHEDLGQAIREVGLTLGNFDPKVLALEISRLRAQRDIDGATALMDAAVSTKKGMKPIYDDLTRAHDKADLIAKKEGEALVAAERAKELRVKGTVTPGATRTISGKDPETGETTIFRETIKPKKAGGPGPREMEPGPGGSPDAEVIYQDWLAREGLVDSPKTRTQFPWEAVRKVVAGVAKVSPEAPRPPVVPVSPVTTRPAELIIEGPSGAPMVQAIEPLAPKIMEAPPSISPPAPAIGAPVVLQVTKGKPLVSSGKEGVKVDPTKVLTPEESEEISDSILTFRTGEVGAFSATEEWRNSIKAYFRGVAAGTRTVEDPRGIIDPKTGKVALIGLSELGARIGRGKGSIPSELEASGILPQGFSRQVSKEVKDALQEAAAEKYGRTVKITGGAVPITDTSLKGAGIIDDVSGPAFLAVNIRRDALRQGIQDGTIPPEAALKEEASIQDEILRLMKSKKEEKGTVLGSGFGSLQTLIEKNPQAALKAVLVAGGALAGGMIDPLDDPVLSMLLGAGTGMAVNKAQGMLRSLHVNMNEIPEVSSAIKTRSGLETVLSNAYHLAPHIQRANYLWSSGGLMANAWVGPYGAAFFGALTKGLGGDPRGWTAMKTLIAPSNWIKSYGDSWKDAVELIRHAEAGDPLARAEIQGEILEKLLGGPTPLKQASRYYVQGPAYAMAAGDLASRKILMQAGFPEKEAREMTLTGEPFLDSLKKIMNLRRGKPSPMLELMAPFLRTPLNILEQGLLRFPGLGLFAHRVMENQGKAETPLAEKAAQQALGLIIGTGSYVVGVMLPPEQARIARRFISNAAGQYSAIAALGFAMGQGSQRTRGGILAGAFSPETVRQLEYSFPMPTTQPIRNWGSYIGGLAAGRPVTIPPGAIPAIFREPPFGGLPDETSRVPAFRGSSQGTGSTNRLGRRF